MFTDIDASDLNTVVIDTLSNKNASMPSAVSFLATMFIGFHVTQGVDYETFIKTLDVMRDAYPEAVETLKQG